MYYRDTLICTVGTSLKGNMLKMADQDMNTAIARHNSQALAARLLQMDPDDRICGAEINSNHDIRKQGFLDEPCRLVLLVSDTPDGTLVGQILKHYYQSGRAPLRFADVELKTLEGLTDQDPKRFQMDGLRNLVRVIAAEARRRSAEHLIINATGGYKAQISFAGMIGQALGIPVCYLFENFDTVIELPPQPISLDLSFWLKNASLFYELENNQATNNPANQEPLFATLVDAIEIDGVALLGLSSMGQLFHETFRYHFRLQKEALVPPASGLNLVEKTVRYEKGVGIRPPGIEQWLGKLLEVPYVKGTYTHWYSPQLQRSNYFRPSSKGIVSKIEGGFSDGRATVKFDVITTATTEAQRDAAVVDLSERFLSR